MNTWAGLAGSAMREAEVFPKVERAFSPESAPVGVADARAPAARCASDRLRCAVDCARRRTRRYLQLTCGSTWTQSPVNVRPIARSTRSYELNLNRFSERIQNSVRNAGLRRTQFGGSLQESPWEILRISAAAHDLLADFWGLSMCRSEQHTDLPPRIDWFPLNEPLPIDVCSSFREHCDEIEAQFRVSIDPVGFFCPTVESFTQQWEQEWILLVNNMLCLYDNYTIRSTGKTLEEGVDRLLFSGHIDTLLFKCH